MVRSARYVGDADEFNNIEREMDYQYYEFEHGKRQNIRKNTHAWISDYVMKRVEASGNSVYELIQIGLDMKIDKLELTQRHLNNRVVIDREQYLAVKRKTIKSMPLKSIKRVDAFLEFVLNEIVPD